MELAAAGVNDPGRIGELRALVRRKGFLHRLYGETYSKYLRVLERASASGKVLELGSGASFVREVIPGVITSDVLPYEGVEQVVDATRMPFEDGSLRAIFMMNVFHHIPDVEAFLREAQRCLVPGGRLFMMDQHVGWLSRLMLGGLHHEPFHPEAVEWRFETTGPLSGANGALAWIVFQRDRTRFETLFPGLKLEFYRPHTPFRYWLAGGLKSWTLLPGWAFGLVTALEGVWARVLPGSCCFADIEIVRRG